MVKSVLNLYNLRFKVITVYVVGLLASLLASLPFVPSLGFYLAIGQTILMLFLDWTIEGRQVLFSQKGVNIEDEIYSLRQQGSTPPTYTPHNIGFFNLYYNKCWKNKPFCKNVSSMDDCYANRLWHFILTRGVMYMAIFVFLIGLGVLIHYGFIETPIFFIR